MFITVLPRCMPGAHISQKKVLDGLELGFRMVVNHMGAEN